jgi:hypothetical protein
MQDVHMKVIRNCHGEYSIKQEDSVHQQIGLKLKEATSKV